MAVGVDPQSKGDINGIEVEMIADDCDDNNEATFTIVHCCDVQRCVKTFDYRRSSTRVIAARGRLKKHESGARPAEASLIDGECRVIARSALLHAA